MIRVVEVGPRDGLQNEATFVPTEIKAQFIAALAGAGVQQIEATSFVSPKWVPQLADAAELWNLLPSGSQNSFHLYSALVPNEKGLERAISVGCKQVALFTAASNSFTQKNINMTVEESLRIFQQLMTQFLDQVPDGRVRAYVSTAFQCPYEGLISPETVVSVVRRLVEMGADEVSIGDTIGVASPREVHRLNERLFDEVAQPRIAYHFHDTNGTAVANVAAALDWGVETFDSSAGGLGGCPYAPGAGGNLATEDLVYFLHREGLTTGIDLKLLARASLPVLELLGRRPCSKAQIVALD